MPDDENHILLVDEEEALNDQKLEERAAALTGEDLVLDANEVQGQNFDQVEASVRAILVKKGSPHGAIRVFGKEIWNVVTGPAEHGFVIVRIDEGEYCRLLGTPTIRCFRRSSR